MGRERERGWTGQYLFFWAAGLIIVVLGACAPFKTMPAEQESRTYQERVHHLMAQGDFEGAMQEHQKVLSLSPNSPPGDAALFGMGLIHVHGANPKKDYKRARRFFTQIEEEFPESPLASQAKVWVGVLEEMAPTAEQESRAHLQSMQLLMAQGDFEGALLENQKVLSLSPKNPPGDAALFGMGLIHVHGANPKKDYKKARRFFTQLEEEFPQSLLASQAKVWVDVLEEMAPTAEQESSAHLQGVQQLMSQGDFEGAQRANQKLLSLAPNSPSVDAALFGMALLHIHYANPKKDYKGALGFFAQLQKEFPRSPLTEEAKVWVSVLEAMERAMRIDIEIEERKKELTR